MIEVGGANSGVGSQVRLEELSRQQQIAATVGRDEENLAVSPAVGNHCWFAVAHKIPNDHAMRVGLRGGGKWRMRGGLKTAFPVSHKNRDVGSLRVDNHEIRTSISIHVRNGDVARIFSARKW